MFIILCWDGNTSYSLVRYCKSSSKKEFSAICYYWNVSFVRTVFHSFTAICNEIYENVLTCTYNFLSLQHYYINIILLKRTCENIAHYTHDLNNGKNEGRSFFTILIVQMPPLHLLQIWLSTVLTIWYVCLSREINWEQDRTTWSQYMSLH